MARILTSKGLWLAVYFSLVAGIAVATVRLRDSMLADRATIDANEQSWQQWREEAAKQDGTTGPVQRVVPKTAEPPMLSMMRDNFGAILGASIVFPGIILGFLMIVLRGVILQATARRGAEPSTIAESRGRP